ncbi:MAG TPA: Crp/Fnr family transcriptional regulator [Candidatus Margulisiibacteriota bacterium]|nr:Crp/Fnr family transcriptional regulator [Candidatus Margulisiibacteriota bacterium]
MHESQASLHDALESLGWPGGVAFDLARSAHLVTFEKGAPIFHAGEPADLLYVIVSGEVKLYYGDAEGERLLVAICRRGELLGSMDLDLAASHESEPAQMFSAQALSRCKLAIITKARAAAAVRDLAAHEILTLVQRVNRDWARFCSRFLAFLMMDVRSRLAYAITEVAETFGIADPRGKLIPLRLSHEDFGELVGASRPMVSKHLKELAKAGLFYKQNGRYILSGADQRTATRAGKLRTLSAVSRSVQVGDTGPFPTNVTTARRAARRDQVAAAAV